MFAGWINSNVSMVTWTNRSSDSAVYCLYSEELSWQCTSVYTQTSSGWIELVRSTNTHTHTHTHTHYIFFVLLQVEFPTLVMVGEGAILTLASHKVEDDSFLHILKINPVRYNPLPPSLPPS